MTLLDDYLGPARFSQRVCFSKATRSMELPVFGGGVVLSDECQGSEYSSRNNHESSNDFENCCVAENVWSHALQLIEKDFGGPV